jgi:hypothetical protein
MGESLDVLRKVLARLFRGRVEVRSEPLPPPRVVEIRKLREGVRVEPLRVPSRVIAAGFFEWGRMRPHVAGNLLGRDVSTPKKVVLVAREAKALGRRIRLAPRLREAKALAVRLPQTRRNRIAYLKEESRPKGASLLAVYSPIMRGQLRKSAIDKRSGDLLLWFDSKESRGERPSALALCRPRGAGAHLEWVWFSTKSSS